MSIVLQQIRKRAIVIGVIFRGCELISQLAIEISIKTVWLVVIRPFTLVEAPVMEVVPVHG